MKAEGGKDEKGIVQFKHLYFILHPSAFILAFV
jgi:hypothetical protein